MRLIKLHVENFGILADYDYDFTDGLNMIKEENGFGKTTLGAFIKVMFYGFDNETKQKNKRERTKYKPWQGGVYGGSLLFEHAGKTYRLNRTFGAEKKEDVFELTDAVTKLDSSDFTAENIGEMIFDINAESFTRTLFISQNEYSHSSFTDIDAKIGSLVDATDDINNHDTAMAKLNKLLEEIGSDKKGELKSIKLELDELGNKVLGKKGIEETIAAREAELKTYQAEIDKKKAEGEALKDKLEKAAKTQDRQKDKSIYEGLLNNYDESKAKWDEEKNYFPLDMPQKQDLDETAALAKELLPLAAKMEENALSDEERDRYRTLKRRYAGVDLSDADFAAVKEKISDFEAARDFIEKNDLTPDEEEVRKKDGEIFSAVGYDKETNDEMIKNWNYERENLVKNLTETGLSADEKRDLEKLGRKFDGRMPDADDIDNLIRDWSTKRESLKTQITEASLSRSELEELEEAKKRFEEAPFDESENDKMISRWKEREVQKAGLRDDEERGRANAGTRQGKMPLLLGLLLTAFSVVLLVITPIAGITLVAGLVLVIYSLISGKKGKEGKSGATPSVAQRQERVKDIEREIQDYFLTHKLPYDADSVEYTLRNFADRHAAYVALQKRYEEFVTKSGDASLAIEETEKKVKEFLQRYDCEYSEANVLWELNKMKEDCKRYENLSLTQKEHDEKSAAARDGLQKIEEDTKKYLHDYGYPFDEKEVILYLDEINKRYNTYDALQKKKNNAQLKENKEVYEKAKKDLDDFFMKYAKKEAGVTGYYKECSDLMQDAKVLADYEKAVKEYDAAKEKQTENLEKINAFFEKYGFSPSQNPANKLDEIKEKVALCAVRESSFADSKSKKEAFEMEHPDYESLLTPTENIEDDALAKLAEANNELNDDVRALEERRLRCDTELNALNDQYNEICECEQRIKKLKQDRAFYKEKKSILEKTKGHLENAKNQLNARYAAPFENALKEYFEMLVEKSDISIDTDAKRNLIIRSKGEKRSEENLSSGYKDLIDLCYRLALAKAMYGGEQPILILDDPFTNLDEEKLANGLELIKKISDEYQVLYLTCHGSRLMAV